MTAVTGETSMVAGKALALWFKQRLDKKEQKEVAAEPAMQMLILFIGQMKLIRVDKLSAS